MNLRLTVVCAAVLAALSTAPAAAILHASAPPSEATPNTLIASGTLVRISLLQSVSSSHNKTGDTFSYKLEDPLMAGTRVASPAGTTGSGKIVDARPAHGGREDGRLRLEFNPIELGDGTKVQLAITAASLQADQNEHNGMASTVSDVADVFVPGYFLFDFLRKGSDVTLGADSPFHVAVVVDAFLSS